MADDAAIPMVHNPASDLEMPLLGGLPKFNRVTFGIMDSHKFPNAIDRFFVGNLDAR
ncbi:MAG: hypothetical protein AAF922_05340 [Pseudomonadota bacterium]